MMPCDLSLLDPSAFKFVPSDTVVHMFKELSEVVRDYVNHNNEYI